MVETYSAVVGRERIKAVQADPGETNILASQSLMSPSMAFENEIK